MTKIVNAIIFILVFISQTQLSYQKLSCDIKEIFTTINICSVHDIKKHNDIYYILYDINSVEGFNLRRDVYIRMIVFLRKLKENKIYKNAKLVLSPFSNLNHWRSRDIDQSHIFWNNFFDLESLKLYSDVIDFWEFFNEIKEFKKCGKIEIDQIFKLQHFKSMFEDGVFVDKFEKTECTNNRIQTNNIFGYENITGKDFSCMNFQGSAMLLEKVLDEHVKKNPSRPYVILFLNAETVLHEHWGNHEYWRARRSMRFNKLLVEISNKFRVANFNSTDCSERVQRPVSWLHEKSYRKAKGGNYLCCHLRRSDFLHGRDKTTPTIQSAALQIKKKLNELNLRKVFISTDCSRNEYKDLKSYLIRYDVVKYSPESYKEKNIIKDGGVSIIDQIICSHARYFIGTYESTFTYRIYEEREIMGFPKNMTFNTLCKYEGMKNCEQNSVWAIVY